MFSSKSFLNRSLLFCCVCNVKAELCSLDVCDTVPNHNFSLKSYLCRKTNISTVDNFLEKYSIGENTFYLKYWKNNKSEEKKDEKFYLINTDDLQNIEKYFKVTKTNEKLVKYNLGSNSHYYTYYQFISVDLLYSVEIKDDLKKIINDYSIEKSNFLDGKKKTEKEITDDYFIKKFCNVEFVKENIENCKAKITYKGDIKKFADENKGYILMCKMNKELTEELENISNDTSNFKINIGTNFLKKQMEFINNYVNLTDKDKYEVDFNKISKDLKDELKDKLRKNIERIEEKQKYLIDKVKEYLDELTKNPSNYLTIETEFNTFVSNDEKKYISLLKEGKINEYNTKKSEINTKINEIKNKISEYNTLKTNITNNLTNKIEDVKIYDVTKTIKEFNTFIEQINNQINIASNSLEHYKDYVADYNGFFITLKNNYDAAVNSKKSEIELGKIEDENVKNICNVINKTITDYIDSFDSITDIDDDKLQLQDVDIENEIKNKISTNLDVEINKITGKVDKGEIKTKVNEFFKTDMINSYKSNIRGKINNTKDKLKITFTLTVRNNLKLKKEFSTKLETIKKKYSDGVLNSVTFDNLKSEISEKGNDVKLFVNNSEVKYSEKITKGITINIEFPEFYLIIEKPKDDERKDDEHKDDDDDPEKHKKPDDDPNKKDKKDQSENNKLPSNIVSGNKKGCCAKCSGRNKTRS